MKTTFNPITMTKKTFSVIVAAIIFVVIVGVVIVQASGVDLKGLVAFKPSAVPLVGKACPSGSPVLTSIHETPAVYSDFSSFYDAVKKGTLKNCSYAVSVSTNGTPTVGEGAGGFQNSVGIVYCKTFTVIGSDAATGAITCGTDVANIGFTKVGSQFSYKINDTSYFNMNSSLYSVHYQ